MQVILNCAIRSRSISDFFRVQVPFLGSFLFLTMAYQYCSRTSSSSIKEIVWYDICAEIKVVVPKQYVTFFKSSTNIAKLWSMYFVSIWDEHSGKIQHPMNSANAWKESTLPTNFSAFLRMINTMYLLASSQRKRSKFRNETMWPCIISQIMKHRTL